MPVRWQFNYAIKGGRHSKWLTDSWLLLEVMRNDRLEGAVVRRCSLLICTMVTTVLYIHKQKKLKESHWWSVVTVVLTFFCSQLLLLFIMKGVVSTSWTVERIQSVTFY